MTTRKYDSRPTVIVAMPQHTQLQPDPNVVEALKQAGYTVERRFGMAYVIVPIDRIAAVTVLNEVQP